MLLLALGGVAAAGRVRGPRRLAARTAAGLGLTLVLVEVAATVIVALGLAGPPPGPGTAPSLLVRVGVEGLPAIPPVPMHLLPEEGRRPGHDPSIARILFVGDSFTEGQAVPAEFGFPARVAAAVRPADGRPVQGINHGVWAFSLEDEAEVFAAWGQAFAPDVVVWTFVPNDLGGGVLSGRGDLHDLVVDRRRFEAGPVVSWSLLAAGIEARRAEAAVIADYRASFDAAGLDRLEATLREVVGATRARGGRFLFVLFPLLWELDALPFADVHAAVAARAEAAGAEVLDLGPELAGHDEARLWVSVTDHHPNAAGHALAAEAIARAIGTDVPRAGPAACTLGGPEARALCATPSATTALAWAEAMHARATRSALSPQVAALGAVLADRLSETLPPEERQRVRERLGDLAARW